MLQPRTLSLYVAREILLYSALGFAAILTVLLSKSLLERLDDLLAIGLGRADFLAISQAMLTMVVPYAVPIAFGFGVLLAVARLSNDHEVLALQAAGRGPATLLGPALVLGSVASGLTALLILYSEPAARLAVRNTFIDVAARGGVLEAGRFRGMGDRLIYVEERERDGGLLGVVISDRSNVERPFLVFAERGRVEHEPQAGSLTLHLEVGEIQLGALGAAASAGALQATDGLEAEAAAEAHLPREAAKAETQRISFATFAYTLPGAAMLHSKAGLRKPEELQPHELRTQLRRLGRGEALEGMRSLDAIDYELELQRRAAFSLAPLLFALFAVPLALRWGRSSPAWGVIACTCMTLAYYALVVFGRTLALEGWIGAAAAYWSPNALFVAGAAFALARPGSDGT